MKLSSTLKNSYCFLGEIKTHYFCSNPVISISRKYSNHLPTLKSIVSHFVERKKLIEETVNFLFQWNENTAYLNEKLSRHIFRRKEILRKINDLELQFRLCIR